MLFKTFFQISFFYSSNLL